VTADTVWRELRERIIEATAESFIYEMNSGKAMVMRRVLPSLGQLDQGGVGDPGVVRPVSNNP
jgi:hypothetical protein